MIRSSYRHVTGGDLRRPIAAVFSNRFPTPGMAGCRTHPPPRHHPQRGRAGAAPIRTDKSLKS
ncbi:hypothetical protein RMP42_05836 [Roseomonas mucosa]|nr:hypothetical protein RMP42_05836 [Roseomonas mucosa]